MTALAAKVMRSVASVRPSVRFHSYLLKQLPLTLIFACVWIVAIAQRGLKVKVRGYWFTVIAKSVLREYLLRRYMNIDRWR